MQQRKPDPAPTLDWEAVKDQEMQMARKVLALDQKIIADLRTYVRELTDVLEAKRNTHSEAVKAHRSYFNKSQRRIYKLTTEKAALVKENRRLKKLVGRLPVGSIEIERGK